jgi:starch synthase
MRILVASSEVHPFSKTGGLADMVGALGKALARADHRTGIVTPLYAGIRERCPELKRANLPLEVPLGMRRVRGEIWTLDPEPGLTIYFVDQPGFFQRAGLYQKDGLDYSDNAERFIFLSKAVVHLARHLEWRPEFVHLNDWQTGFAALMLYHQREILGHRSTPRCCVTIHNLAYQGLFPASHFALTNLPWEYFHPSGAEFYGKISCLKAGISFADIITTVSPRYAREITTEEFGCGLDGLLRYRQASLHGILNGVDYDEWSPSVNHHIMHPYSVDNLDRKVDNKIDLQREYRLPVTPSVPLFGNIGRLVEQKGVDIMLGALEEMLGAGFQFVLLGTGAPAFQRAYQDLARRHPRQVAVKIGFDESMSHRIEAGCDFFIMPSRFEPCGLNQMYSLRYGTIPIVRATGGLDDTVTDPRENLRKANGIKFFECSARALSKALRKALVLYQNPEVLQRFQHHAMTVDFSWDRTAKDYLRLYRKVVPRSQGNEHRQGSQPAPEKIPAARGPDPETATTPSPNANHSPEL